MSDKSANPFDSTKIDLDAIMKKSLDELTPTELKLRAAQLEKKIASFGVQIRGDSIAGLSPNDLVEVNVPLSSSGDMFNINGTTYFGVMRVKLKVARQLASMISENYKIERERLQSRNSPMAGALMRGEDLLKVKRFQQIMSED